MARNFLATNIGGTKSKSANALNLLPFELEELEKLEQEVQYILLTDIGKIVTGDKLFIL